MSWNELAFLIHACWNETLPKLKTEIVDSIAGEWKCSMGREPQGPQQTVTTRNVAMHFVQQRYHLVLVSKMLYAK